MNKTIRKRMFLEKKYSNYCLFFKIPLPEVGNRVVSISPSAYYYHTGIREQSGDSKIFKELSLKSHFGTRLEIENEVNKIIKIDNYALFGVKYFFELKNLIIHLNYDEFNKMLSKNKLNRIKKYEFNRILKLFRRWGEESFKCHYKISGAKKRIHKKIKKTLKIDVFNS